MDMIVLTEVFEHLSIGPGKIFAEIQRVLKPNGVLVFSLPNSTMLKNRVLSFFRKPVLDPVYTVFKEEKSQYSKGNGVWIHGFGHVREYTMSETIDIVQHYGFDVLAKRSIDSFIVPPKGFSKAQRLLMPFYRFSSGIVPNSRMINLVLAKMH